MKFDEFVNSVKQMNGVDKDGAYGKQCMDLYNYYCKNVLGLSNTGAKYAKEILNNPNIMDNVIRIDNYREFVPEKGDICVFTGSKYGHIAICLGIGNINNFKTLDQNWKKQRLTEEVHNYTYMAPLVFLRPKNRENIIGVSDDKNNSNNNNLNAENKYKIGDKVRFSTCYKSSTAPISQAISAKNMLRNIGTITKIIPSAPNKYLLDNGLCWVNDGDIREIII